MEASQLRVPAPSVAKTERVCAIVVTYHPDSDVPHHLTLLRPQVGHIIVVDNGSGENAVAMLQQASREVGCELILNRENLGIASALNVGVEHALVLGFDWLLLFDQDSYVTANFTTSMLAAYSAISSKRAVGILAPCYVDRRTGHALPLHGLKDGSLATAMTSGSLIAATTFAAFGLFADELFIDSVDHEYSLRVRGSGHVVALCENACLMHSPGTPRSHALFGMVRFQSSNYAPARRYYQERNKVWMYRRYAIGFPGFCAKEAMRSLIDLAKILLAEESKKEKCRSIFRGLYDGLRGRMGRAPVTL